MFAAVGISAVAVGMVLYRPIPGSVSEFLYGKPDLNGLLGVLALAGFVIWTLWDPLPHRSARGLRNAFALGALGFMGFPVVFAMTLGIEGERFEILINPGGLGSVASLLICSVAAVYMEREYSRLHKERTQPNARL